MFLITLTWNKRETSLLQANKKKWYDTTAYHLFQIIFCLGLNVTAELPISISALLHMAKTVLKYCELLFKKLIIGFNLNHWLSSFRFQGIPEFDEFLK